ncbi:DUF4265 domain-containing protein [Kutzneria sp. NPDC052558]|uniref:DUF4265 domain-containing protein n=1 Tax=Kutzneria sp. NPDC052558 TaxID=3364121 RepID=UPI0037C5E8DE
MSMSVRLAAGVKTTGEIAYEEVLVTELPDGNYRLDCTPGLVLGVAAGDCIAIDKEKSSFSVHSRGGNLAIQIYGPRDVALSIKNDVHELGGRHDGGERNLTVYTIPVAAGFPAVEALLNSLSSKDPRIQWYFGNVYDENDGVTPLNWW